MRMSYSSTILGALAGLSSFALAEAPTNPTQGDMSAAATDWLAHSVLFRLRLSRLNRKARLSMYTLKMILDFISQLLLARMPSHSREL